MKYYLKLSFLIISALTSSASIAKELPSSEEFQNLLTGCAMGSELEVNANLIGSITDIYSGSKTQGKAVVNIKSKLLELMPERDRLEAYKTYVSCIDKILSDSEAYRPAYSEPSEYEMKRSILNAMQSRGGKLREDGSVAVENPIDGVSIKLIEFEKLGCEPATYGTGYFCNYSATLSTNFFSNERSEAGRNHAAAVNVLFGFLNGGKNTSTETSLRRFIKSKGGWLVADT